MHMWFRSSSAAKLAALFVFAALVTSCSLFGGDNADVTPTATSEPQDGAGPVERGPVLSQPDPPGTVYNVEWIPDGQPETPQGPEVESALVDVVPDVEAIWRLFVVEGESAEPRLLQESTRWLRAPVWQTGDVTVVLEYFTFVEGEGFTFGYSELDVATGTAAWDFRKSLDDSYIPTPDAARFAVLSRAASPGLFTLSSLSVTTPLGETSRLEGFRFQDFRGWSPDGRYLIATGLADEAPPPVEPPRDYYLVEPEVDEVVLIARPPRQTGLSLAWSPDSSSIALIEDGDLVIFDVETRVRRVVALELAITSPPAWSADGRYIAVGDGVLEVDSELLLVTPTSQFVIDTRVSPDGRFLAVTPDPLGGGDCRQPQDNPAILVDVATGDSRVLVDCDGDGVNFRIEWLAPDRFLLTTVDCYACDGSGFGLQLVTLPGGDVLNLTEGREARGTFAVSPDGSRILLGGDRLRLFDSNGMLLREIEPPAGYSVTGVSWSNDGSSFAYVVGPTRVNLL